MPRAIRVGRDSPLTASAYASPPSSYRPGFRPERSSARPPRRPTTTPPCSPLCATGSRFRPTRCLPAQESPPPPRLSRYSRSSARTDLPVIPPPVGEVKATDTFKAPNPIQKSLVSAYAVQQGQDPATVTSTIKTRQDAIDYFQKNPRR